MKPLTVATFLWVGNRDYAPRHVNALARMVRKHLPIPHRFVCIACGPVARWAGFDKDVVSVVPLPDPIEMTLGHLLSPEGERFPSSYRRLWIFSRAAQEIGERVFLLDIDCVPVADLSPYVAGDDPFICWRPRSSWGRPNRIAGGQYVVEPGAHHALYADFVDDPHGSIKRAADAGFRGSDQALLSQYFERTAPSWPNPNGIYQNQDIRTRRAPKVYKHPGQPISIANPLLEAEWQLPDDARIVHFNGSRKAWSVMHWPWIERHFVPYYSRESR